MPSFKTFRSFEEAMRSVKERKQEYTCFFDPTVGWKLERINRKDVEPSE